VVTAQRLSDFLPSRRIGPALHHSLLSLHRHHQSFFSSSKLPHRLLASLHPLRHSLLHTAHLYFHTAPVANNPPVSPVSPASSPGTPTFHPHHHPVSSALRPCRSPTPRTDLLLLLLLLLLHLSSLCSSSLVVQPGEHGEEESEDPAEEADPKETSSAGAEGERDH